jgi:hypothetical protein
MRLATNPGFVHHAQALALEEHVQTLVDAEHPRLVIRVETAPCDGFIDQRRQLERFGAGAPPVLDDLLAELRGSLLELRDDSVLPLSPRCLMPGGVVLSMSEKVPKSSSWSVLAGW